MINLARVKRGMYFDSITLMKLARALNEMDGIKEVAALMATPANLQALTETGLAPFVGLAEEPGSGDVLIVVQASDEAHARAALEAAEAQLLREAQTTERDGEARTRQPRSLEEARRGREQEEPAVAVISVPGMYAALETQQALRAGLHVFLFSDNVSLEDEVALKRLGAERGLLVMGPDCGTALWQGAGLGFVNVVPEGSIGLVGASGTGMQQVMSLLAEAGHGISQAIGCGGRDLSAEVGGLTTLQGLRLLQADERTRVIVLISKPPAPEVAERVLAAAASGPQPVVAIFVGADAAPWRERYAGRIFFASTLTEAARLAGALCSTGQVIAPAPEPSRRGTSLAFKAGQPPYLAALFSGGTLCEEALHIWGEQLGPVYSNIPLKAEWRWREQQSRAGHYALDLGADEYTRGRPHPMIDPEARLAYLREAAGDPRVGVILLDIVLGYCAHPNPAGLYAPLILEILRQAGQSGRYLHVVVSLCGTTDDPQRLAYQEAHLRNAGAEVYTSNAEAAARCLELLSAGQSRREEH